jgi:hypothetical protein
MRRPAGVLVSASSLAPPSHSFWSRKLLPPSSSNGKSASHKLPRSAPQTPMCNLTKFAFCQREYPHGHSFQQEGTVRCKLKRPRPDPSTQSATEISDECRSGSDGLSLSTRLLVENAPRLNNSDLHQPVGNRISHGTAFPLAKLIDDVANSIGSGLNSLKSGLLTADSSTLFTYVPPSPRNPFIGINFYLESLPFYSELPFSPPQELPSFHLFNRHLVIRQKTTDARSAEIPRDHTEV